MKSKQRESFISVISMITIAGITIGVAALVTVLSMMNGFESEVRERIVGTLAHVSIFTFDDVGIQETEELLAEIRPVEHVVAAAPFIYYKASISSSKENDGTMVRGIDPRLEREVSNLTETITRGELNLDTLDTGLPGIILGITLAERLGVTVGSRIVLMSLKDLAVLGGVAGMKMPKVAQFTVSGIFSNGLHEYDASLCYISIPSAQRLFKMEQMVTGIQIKLDDMYRSSEISDRLNEQLGYPYFATDWTQMHKSLYSWMKLEKYGMFLGFALIIAVAAFNIIFDNARVHVSRSGSRNSRHACRYNRRCDIVSCTARVRDNFSPCGHIFHKRVACEDGSGRPCADIRDIGFAELCSNSLPGIQSGMPVSS
jgi:lipoprotein-releasing system permease protein